MGGINKALRLFKKLKTEAIKSGKDTTTDLKTFKSLYKRQFKPLYKQQVEAANLSQFKQVWKQKSGVGMDFLSQKEKKGIQTGEYTKKELKNLAKKISGGDKGMMKWMTGVKFNKAGEIIGGKAYKKNKRIIAGNVNEAYDKIKDGVHDTYRFKDPFNKGWTQSLTRPALPGKKYDEKYNPPNLIPPPIPDPKVDLITPKITPTKLDVKSDVYSLKKSVRTKTDDGRPMTPWEIWFSQQPPNTIQKYPGDSNVPPGEFLIEFIPGTPGTPPTTTSQTNYQVTRNGVPLGDLDPEEQAYLYKQAKREYLKTAEPTDPAKMYFEEFGYDKSWDEFLEYQKNNK